MKLFVWAEPYGVNYGSSMLIAVAETVEQAREIAVKAPGYSFAQYRDVNNEDWVIAATLGEPTRIVDLPCAEWHQWSE